MPLLDFWTTEEGTVVVKTATTVTLTLAPTPRIVAMNPDIVLPVATGTYPWDNRNQTTRNSSTYNAAYRWLDENLISQWNIPSDDIWDYRNQYVRMLDEIVKYTAYRSSLPASERGKVDIKLGNFQRLRDQYRLLAGEPEV